MHYQITVNKEQLIALRYACELLARCCLYESTEKKDIRHLQTTKENSQIAKDIERYCQGGASILDACRNVLDMYTQNVDHHRTPWDLMQVFRYQLWNERKDKPQGWGGTDSNTPMKFGPQPLAKVEKVDLPSCAERSESVRGLESQIHDSEGKTA